MQQGIQNNRVLVPAIATPPASPAGVIHDLGGVTMGTGWSVLLVAPERRSLLRLDRAIRAQFDRIVAEMSGWESLSVLRGYNRALAGSRHLLPAGFQAVLTEALRVAAATGGAFDPTMGELADLWGFGPTAASQMPPHDDVAATARANAGWHRIAFDADGSLVQPGGLTLDFSGIAKGYAVDCIAELLIDAGFPSFLVEIGGELRGRGVKPDGLPWWVTLEEPPVPVTDEPIVVALHELAVATSGSYRRNFEHAGTTYAHTLDPRTGQPLVSELVSVSVLHASCMTADALATALTVLGVDAGTAFARDQQIAARFITADGTETLTPAFLEMLD